MGQSVIALVKDSTPELVQALKSFCKKLNVEYIFNKNGFNSSGSEFIQFPSLERSMHVMSSSKSKYQYFEVNGAKSGVLPTAGKTLKNAKNVMVLSLGANEQGQNLMVEFLKSHPSHGYILLNDCGFNDGKFLYVNEKGIVRNKQKEDEQFDDVVKFFNDMPTKVKRVDDLKEVFHSKEDVYKIKKVYYDFAKSQGKVLLYNGHVKLVNYMVIMMEDGTNYYVDAVKYENFVQNTYYNPSIVGYILQIVKNKQLVEDWNKVFRY